MTRSIKTTLLFTTLFLAASMLLTAQTHQGMIRGNVIDPTGAVVPGATVTATNDDTGQTVVSVSSSVGAYGLVGLQPGTYTLQTQMDGFKTLVMEGLRVDLAAVLGMDLRLEIGEATETIDVTAETPLLQTENVEVRTVIEPEVFIDLPLSLEGAWGGGRNPGTFVYLAPGVTAGFGNEDATFYTSTNGSQLFAEEIQLDGVSMQIFSHTSAFVYLSVLSPDAVQEFSLGTHNYSAEFGNAHGAVQRYTIRSGTNEIHGTLYHYIKNNALDASGFFRPEATVNKKNEYGFAVGGPIKRNRTFWFANMQWLDWVPGSSLSTRSVPTSAFKQGDLSLAGVTIYDPATTQGSMRSPFANNQIPSSRISSVSAKSMPFFPGPNSGSGVVNNYISQSAGRFNKDDFIYKFNHIFNDSHSAFGSWNKHRNVQTCPPTYPYPLGRCISQDVTGYNPRMGWDWVISPTTFNHAVFGWNFHHQPFFIDSDHKVSGDDWGQILGISNTGLGPFPRMLMSPFEFGGGGGGGPGEGFGQYRNVTYVISDTLSIVRGRHNFKIGGEIRHLEVNETLNSNTVDAFFEPTETGLPGVAGTGYPFASFLLGDVDNGFRWINEISPTTFTNYVALFAQDDWKMTNKLTLNIGLRWNYYQPLYEKNDNVSIMVPNVPNPGASGHPGAMVFAANEGGGNPFIESSYNNFGPRLGIAYNVMPDVVVRAGYGIAYFPTTVLGGGGHRAFAQGFQAVVKRNSADGGLTPAFNWDNGFPSDFEPPPFIDPAFNLKGQVHTFPDGANEPAYSQQWNFNLQWEFARNWLVDVGYVGSKGTHLQTGLVNPSQVPSSFLRLGDLLNKSVTDPAVSAAGFGAPFANFVDLWGADDATLARALTPFPQYSTVSHFGPVFPYNAPVGNSIYHSLQMKVEKRFSDGLFLLSSFTWAKKLTDSDSTWGAFFSAASRDTGNLRLERGLGYSDVPVRMVTALIYELPFGRGKPFASGISKAANLIIGGWQLNTIVEYTSGAPTQVSVANTLPIFNFKNMPNVISGVNQAAGFGGKFDPATDRYLNLAAFAEAGNAVGNSPYPLSEVRGFGIKKEHVGFMKTINITERILSEFRFEVFNLFNRTQFRNPNGNVSDPVAFGTIGGQINTPRQGQFSLRFRF
jgi:hypothetical protein